MNWIFNTSKLIHKKSHLVTTGAFSEKQLFLSTASKVGQGNVFGREGILQVGRPSYYCQCFFPISYSTQFLKSKCLISRASKTLSSLLLQSSICDLSKLGNDNVYLVTLYVGICDLLFDFKRVLKLRGCMNLRSDFELWTFKQTLILIL